MSIFSWCELEAYLCSDLELVPAGQVVNNAILSFSGFDPDSHIRGQIVQLNEPEKWAVLDLEVGGRVLASTWNAVDSDQALHVGGTYGLSLVPELASIEWTWFQDPPGIIPVPLTTKWLAHRWEPNYIFDMDNFQLHELSFRLQHVHGWVSAVGGYDRPVPYYLTLDK